MSKIGNLLHGPKCFQTKYVVPIKGVIIRIWVIDNPLLISEPK